MTIKHRGRLRGKPSHRPRWRTRVEGKERSVPRRGPPRGHAYRRAGGAGGIG